MRSWMVCAVSLVFLAALAGLVWRRRPPVGRWLPRVALPVVVVLALVSGYIAWREHRALGELTAVIDPFPGIERALYVPVMRSDGRTWMFRTAASPSEVHRFYQREDHRRGWTVRQDSGLHMVLDRPGLSLDLSIQADEPGRVVLVYTLTRRAER